MPTITLNKKVFEDLVGKKLPLDQLKDRISMLGTDLDRIEGNDIIVEVFPNRPDMLSEQGFARAFSSFIGVKPGLVHFPVKTSDFEVIVDKSVASVRPYTVCAVIKGLQFTDERIREVIQIQEKLHVTLLRKRKKGAIGIYPTEHIAFPITYMAKKPEDIRFQPLEFSKELDGRQILSQHPAGKEYGHLLEGQELFPLFVDDKGQVLSMPPIINSHITGRVDGQTSAVFIECSGSDLSVLTVCLNIIVAALADMGGEIFSVTIRSDVRSGTLVTPAMEPTPWPIDLAFVNKMLGLDLKEKDIKQHLARMGFGYEKGNVLVPAYRADIMHQVDFVEDIAIAYGYENFVPELPNVATIGQEDPFETYKRYVAEILSGLSLLECETYHLSNIDNLNRKMHLELDCVPLSNALTVDYSVLRSWILPSLMQILQENKHHEYPQKIFALGTAFKKDPAAETGVDESVGLATALCGDGADYTKIRQVFDYLMRTLGIAVVFKSYDHPSFIPGRCAQVCLGDTTIAFLGELAPEVLRAWNLEMPVAAFELNLSVLFKKKP